MNIIIHTSHGHACFDAHKIARAIERHERGVGSDVYDLPPGEWTDIDDGSSGAPASAGCV